MHCRASVAAAHTVALLAAFGVSGAAAAAGGVRYGNFIKERFERCLDLYLCPRTSKVRKPIRKRKHAA